jgi:hypothetical protein
MASRRRWLRRSAEDPGEQGDQPGEPQADPPVVPAPAAEDSPGVPPAEGWPPPTAAPGLGPDPHVSGPLPTYPGPPPGAPGGPGEPGGPGGPGGPAGDDPDRTPLVQARYDRMVAAAGIEPYPDLSDHARSVLDWLARQDDATCSGVVELLQATSLATLRHQ